MAKYIEQEAAIEILNIAYPLGMDEAAYDTMHSMISKLPAADVVEVRHGRWSMTKDGAAYCSACKRKMNPYLYGYAHCAMCGARMDGGSNRIEIDTVKNGGVNDGKA